MSINRSSRPCNRPCNRPWPVVLLPGLLFAIACSSNATTTPTADGAQAADSPKADAATAIEVGRDAWPDGLAGGDVAATLEVGVPDAGRVDVTALDVVRDAAHGEVPSSVDGALAEVFPRFDVAVPDGLVVQDAAAKDSVGVSLDAGLADLGFDTPSAEALGVDAGSADAAPGSIPPSLDGTWLLPCNSNCTDCDQWGAISYTFRQNRLQATYTIYLGDNTCSSASALAWRDGLDATWKWVSQVEGTNGAWGIDVTVTALTATALSAFATDQANQSRVRGFSDWQVGVSKNTAGTPKVGSSDTEPALGETRLGLLKREQDRLYLGNLTGPFPIDRQRPTAVNTKSYLTLTSAR